ncbi:MAG TPA: ABC transporter substrate-binding protein [Candidatus Polarisedimenticolia bacterium]|nr:ABC transporter substrate-binding protein [Candidatus Polarisedimenticolia bacterium]
MSVARIRTVVAALVVALAVASCGIGSTPTPAATKLVVGLGFISSVQFAPFYLADQAGYYRDAGLDVELQNQIDPNLVPLVGQGAIDIGTADGTSVIPAVSQDIPIVYVATIYGKFPSIVFSKASSGIETAADLAGKKIGIPGRYGSSWIMLQALLGSAGLTPDDVEIVEYPDFGQGTALAADAVDAATGFANNEPVSMELSGTEVNVLHVDDVVALPGPGLIASRDTLSKKGAAVKAFIAATLRAMHDIANDPAKGVDAAIVAVPALGAVRPTEEAILAATIAVWAPYNGNNDDFGTIDEAGWQASLDYMVELGDLVAKPVTLADLVDSSYLP